ncbi:MAG: hypothetical protein P4L84_15740 [Isosphaeraceae bacterium]|nr:hypothetical protein [Isosphaeraceae bacterium]
MIILTCPGCGARLKGRGSPTRPAVACPRCGASVPIPSADPEPAPPAQPEGVRLEPLPEEQYALADVEAPRSEPIVPAPSSAHGPARRRSPEADSTGFGPRTREARATTEEDEEQEEPSRQGPLVWVALAAVVVLLGFAGYRWWPAGRGSAPKGPPGSDAPLTTAPARPSSELTSTSLLADAPKPGPGTWNVTPDGAKPPAGLGSAFMVGWPFGEYKDFKPSGDYGGAKPFKVRLQATPTIFFGRADRGQAAVLVDIADHQGAAGRERRLYRYDLRHSPLPLGSTNLKRSHGLVADISPDGRRLAVFWESFDEGESTPKIYPLSVLSAETGERVGSLPIPPRRVDSRGVDIPLLSPASVWFLDDDHLAVFDQGQGVLEVWDVTFKDRSSRVDCKLGGPVLVTPGRGWIIGYTGDSFEWRRIPTGELGGTLRLPAALPADRSTPAIAISPDGARFAAYLRGPEKHILLTWDVATGALRDVVMFPRAFAATDSCKECDLHLQWAGPRALLFAGLHLVDLDLRTTVWSLFPTPSLGQNWARPRPGPDERFWWAAVPPEGNALWDELAAQNPQGPERLADSFLLAGNPFPPALARYREDLRQDLILNRDVPLCVEAQGLDAPFRERVVKAISEVPWVKSYEIDPNAPVRLRLRIHPTIVGTSHRVSQMRHKLSGAIVNLTLVRPEVFVKGTVEIADKSGAVRWSSSHEIAANATIDPEYHIPDRLRELYPEAYDGRSGPEIEAKYPAQAAAAREDFLKVLDAGLRGSFDTDKPAIRFPANSPVLRTGAITIDGRPEPEPSAQAR